VDALWEAYRAQIDKTLDETADPTQIEIRRAVRYHLALFTVKCIVRWMDRIEREPDPARRRAFLAMLLGRDGTDLPALDPPARSA
jgi:hypothetical protein